MKIKFSSMELDSVQDTINNLGLGYIDLHKLVNGESKEYTLEDLGLPTIAEFETPVMTLTEKHFVNLDGHDDSVYTLWIHEEFIVDVVNLYGTSFKFGFEMVKEIYTKFRLFIEPVIKGFISKWTSFIDSHKTIDDDDLEF